MTASNDATGPYPHVAVVGAGAWGTALAIAGCAAGRRVTLWGREPDVVESILAKRDNTRYMPGEHVPEGVVPTNDMAAATSAEVILLVASAQYLRSVVRDMKPTLKPGTALVICSKGIEVGTGKLLTELVAEEAPEAHVCVLSGPSFARDVARGLPTAVSVGGPMPVARRVQASFARPLFRPYATDDVTGVSLGGAAKNVYAIACGMAGGAGLGESARAAILARSFSELLRLGAALGARPETLMGLAGLGDLALTATSRTSRNFDFGFRLAAHEEQARGPSGDAPPLAEGASTAQAIVARAAREGVDLPIAAAVNAILTGKLTVKDAVDMLLTRPLKDE